MEVVALTLSIVAIAVAAVSAIYTARQAQQQKRVADIESARRSDELEERQRADLASRRANLRLHVQREEIAESSIDEASSTFAIVASNDGPADASELSVTIVAAWNNTMGTRACFAGGERQHRVGRLPAFHREVLPLKADPEVDYGDIGHCEVAWRDGASPDRQLAMRPARPNWH
jgi:hypothetical protein